MICIVFTLLWAKTFNSMNIRDTLANMVVTLYCYCAATASKVLLCNFWPLYGCAIGEYFRDKGQHALIV